MFEGDSADTRSGKIPLTSMGGQAEGLACCFLSFLLCQRYLNPRRGFSLPGLRTLDPLLGPPSTPVEIFRRTCLQSHLQTSSPTAKNSYPKFLNPKTTFEIFTHKKTLPRRLRGGSPINITGVSERGLLWNTMCHLLSFVSLQGKGVEVENKIKESTHWISFWK